MNGTTQTPAGFTPVDQNELSEIEGGLPPVGDLLLGAAAVALGTGNIGGGIALGAAGFVFKWLFG